MFMICSSKYLSQLKHPFDIPSNVYESGNHLMMQNHFNQEFKLSKTSARVLLCFNYFFSHLSQFLSSILGNCMRTLGSYGISSNN